MPILPLDTGRYGSKEIREIFDDNRKLYYQLRFEAEVAIAQGELGVIPESASKEIVDVTNSNRIRLKRIRELESISEHDTAAFVESIAELCSDTAKPWVHYGLTSSDIVDTSISLQLKDSIKIIENKLLNLAMVLSDHALQFKDLPAVGRTHGQHASILSFGLKFAVWASEIVRHLERIDEGKKRFLVCKTLGVVGTGSVMEERALEVQRLVAGRLGLFPVDSATQVVPRERYAEAQFFLALVGTTLDKMAVEIRNLQRTEIGEVSEPFKKGQMGSSAVPVKRNPIKSERVSSLSKLLRALVDVAMENVSLWHERDLSNSANERFTIPMTVILLDEMLNLMTTVISNLEIHTERIASNLSLTNGQIHAEFVLDLLIKKGIPRFDAYRDIQRVAFSAIENKQSFLDAIQNDSELGKHLTLQELLDIFEPGKHLSASTTIIQNIAKMVYDAQLKYAQHS
ncbi:MAG TPA: adenylosuccinate lyase [Nitrososphaeraceae archaeon]|jgi:adenylosuccinate lyase|nr:adenylosuccinate lyase [Nitrososphaeraceae archaeon]